MTLDYGVTYVIWVDKVTLVERQINLRCTGRQQRRIAQPPGMPIEHWILCNVNRLSHVLARLVNVVAIHLLTFSQTFQTDLRTGTF